MHSPAKLSGIRCRALLALLILASVTLSNGHKVAESIHPRLHAPDGRSRSSSQKSVPSGYLLAEMADENRFVESLSQDTNTSQSVEGSPILAKKVTFPDLRYRILEHFGHVWFCDPDMFPIGRFAKERADALLAFPEIQKDTATFSAIAKHLEIKGVGDLSDEQKVAVYREDKKLLWALRFTALGNNSEFTIGVKNTDGDFRIKGTVDKQGRIIVLTKETTLLTCPKCLAASTLIDTPGGQVLVKDLKSGGQVWTLDANGHRISSTILETVAVPVSQEHRMTHLVLKDGRQIWASPMHPTCNGRTVSQLEKNAIYDGAAVEINESAPYALSETYDLLPAGATGFYWANGILLASTLR
jgi:hypothetical protein